MGGKRAFDGRSEAELIRAVLKCRPTRLDQVREVPPRVNEWVMQCLQKKPSSRPESVRSILFELEELCRNREDEGRGDVRACMRKLWPTQAGVKATDIAAQATAMKKPRAKKEPQSPGQTRGLGITLAIAATSALGLWLWPGAPDPTAAKPFDVPEVVDDRPPQKTFRSAAEVQQDMVSDQVRSQMGPQQALNRMSIAVTSEPAGAIVQLDGIKQADRTPMTLRGLRPGQTYQIDVSLPGWYAWSESIVADGRPLAVKLKPLAQAP